MRRATIIIKAITFYPPISIHALLAESDASGTLSDTSDVISIHALLAESDQAANGLADAPPEISIHALLAESDVVDTVKLANAMLFLSTLSLRRATALTAFQPYGSPEISIHALLAESDHHACKCIRLLLKFLSTLSLRRATQLQGFLLAQGRNFYPRSPCGERQSIFKNNILCSLFLSTLSLRRATMHVC